MIFPTRAEIPLHLILLCRVLMGNINYCDLAFPGDGGPSKNQFNISDLVNGVINGEYHSVLGDREKCRRTFREFIVYDNAQVYIEWIIWYKRDMSPGSSPGSAVISSMSGTKKDLQAGLSSNNPDDILLTLKQAKAKGFDQQLSPEFNNLIEHYRGVKGLPATWKIKLTDAEQKEMISSLSGTNIKAHFQKLLDQTWIPKYTRDRRGKSGRGTRPSEVLAIRRIKREISRPRPIAALKTENLSNFE